MRALVFCLALCATISTSSDVGSGRIVGPAGGVARIRCLENSVGIEFDNLEAKEGRLYARRFGHDSNCMQHYTTVHPRAGLEYTLTVVISYDHSHMTEDDQMFSLSCRYYANHKDVGTVMEVSTYPKNYLIGGRNGPSCEYSLKYGSLNGPPAQNAKIGDKVFHEWKCVDSSFAFKVYDCFVHDGANKRYKLIDEEGCSKDKTIIPDLTYDPSLSFAFAASRVFKFAESTKMFFNCLLYMCPKSDPACREAVPPRCGGRHRRSISDAYHYYTTNSTVPMELDFEKSSEDYIENNSVNEPIHGVKNHVPNTEVDPQFPIISNVPNEVENDLFQPRNDDPNTSESNFSNPPSFITTTAKLPVQMPMEIRQSNDEQDVEEPLALPENDHSGLGGKTTVISAPIAELKTVEMLESVPCSSTIVSKGLYLTLVGSNLLSLATAAVAVGLLCKKKYSARLEINHRGYVM